MFKQGISYGLHEVALSLSWAGYSQDKKAQGLLPAWLRADAVAPLQKGGQSTQHGGTGQIGGHLHGFGQVLAILKKRDGQVLHGESGKGGVFLQRAQRLIAVLFGLGLF